jgi:hypothetical protein
VSIVAQSEQDQVESRRLSAKEGLQFGFVFCGSLLWRTVARDGMDILRRQGDVVEQCLARHPGVATREAARDTALVAPEDVHGLPGKRWHRLS